MTDMGSEAESAEPMSVTDKMTDKRENLPAHVEQVSRLWGGGALPENANLGDGLHVVQVPIPDNPLQYTLVYVLETDAGPVLVDTGWHDEVSAQALKDGVATAGFDLADVHGVVITHHHPDHHGLSGVVRDASDCWIAMHPADQVFVTRFREFRGDEDDDWQERSDQMFLRVGATREDLRALPQYDQTTEIRVPAVPDVDLVDRELVDTPGRTLRTIWTPGHSPGHCAFLLEDRRWLFSGDHVLPKITPHVGLYAPTMDDSDPLGEFLDSLRMLVGMGVEKVLPAHRFPFDDLEGRVDEIIHHHDERLDEVTTLLTDGPATPWDIAQRLTWNVEWLEVPVVMRRAALAEASAHLRHLERRDRVRVVADAPLTFALAD